MRPLLPALLLLMTAPAHAAWLHLCPASRPAPGQPSATVTQPDGKLARLVVAEDKLPGCAALELQVAASDVEALYPFAQAARPETTILLQGSMRNARFVPSGHTFPPAKPAPDPPAPAPLHANLLAHMQVRPFGVEERVRASLGDGRLAVRCGAGSKPAGVLLSGPWYLPRATLALALQSTGAGRFGMSVADARHAGDERALAMGAFDAAQPARLGLPRGLERGNWKHFVIACPQHESSLVLASLALEPVAARQARRGTWVWTAADWQADGAALVAWARREQLAELFIAVPQDERGIKDPAALSSFVTRAHAAGIAVWSVDGDPHMVLVREQRNAMRHAAAYAAYNARVPPAARLDGVQFDVEPYLLPGYDSESPEWDSRYLKLAQALRNAVGKLRLELVVPYWWASKQPLLDGLSKAADGLVVMNYRTDPGEIYRFAVPWLDWAARYHKRVRIALEAGPVAPETQRRYRRAGEAEAGELQQVRVGGFNVLLVSNKPFVQPGAQAFKLERTVQFDGSATSFSHDKEHLRALLPRLERDFGAWPGFAGIALHALR